jgi:thymidine phosphorylase
VLPQEIIRAKRDGGVLDAASIEEFVAGMVSGAVTEGQAAAFAMATFFRGMDNDESVALTRAMTASGRTLSWSLDGPVLDKHSTGGVGDTVSLMLAPMVAACGGFVPMISGRGLGHTGGTFDKFESIPGYEAAPDLATFQRVVREVGCSIIGQTPELAPADKLLYGIRDVTATVESIPLITASILSKKLAAGLDGLVMDVKFGNGAFMSRLADARDLALSIATVATSAGLPTTALLTDMDQPLAHTAGNALEVAYAIDYLTGTSVESRMHEVVVGLGAEMLVLGGLSPTVATARERLQRALDSGDAADRFSRMVAAMGGPRDLLERADRHLEMAPVTQAVFANEAGVVTGIDTRSVGLAVVVLGGGRTRPQDPIDHGVGLTQLAAIGDAVGVGGDHRPLAVVHARSTDQVEAAAREIRAAYRIGHPTERSDVADEVVRERITA